jgi:hypothetical protein
MVTVDVSGALRTPQFGLAGGDRQDEGGRFGAPAFPYRRHDKYDSQ